jgi:putative resolvase
MDMKLADWARETGVSYRTAWRWWRAGILPVPAYQTESGSIIVEPPGATETDRRAAIYARIDEGRERPWLDSQVSRLAEWAAILELNVAAVVREAGSLRQPRLVELLEDSSVRVILVERIDRLCLGGARLVQAALRADGRQVLTLDPPGAGRRF